MKALLLSLVFCLASGCQTAASFREVPPATEADQRALSAMVVDIEHRIDPDDEPEEWLVQASEVYAVLRAASGNPISVAPGQGLLQARLVAFVEEFTDAELSILDNEWARAAVRIYAAWREARGDPIPHDPETPPNDPEPDAEDAPGAAQT